MVINFKKSYDYSAPPLRRMNDRVNLYKYLRSKVSDIVERLKWIFIQN